MRSSTWLLPLALVLACTAAPAGSTLPFEPAGPHAAPDPAKPGPYPVGVRTLTLTDPSRNEADGTPRSMVVEIWYPAVDAARGKPGVEYDINDVLTDEQRAQVAALTLPHLVTSAVRDAAARKDDGPFPLVVFSHGHGGIRWQSTFYTVALASHGYVVVAPDHTGDTLVDAVRNRLDDVLVGFDHRPADVTFLLDTFTALASADPLAGMVDPAHIGITGHSFGALTSLRVAAYDDRVKAIVPQAPATADLAFAGKPSDFSLTIPVLVEAAHRDHTLTWAEHTAPTWARLKPPRAMLDITNGGHFTFSDLCAFDLSNLVSKIGFADLSNVVDDGCNKDQPSAAQTQPIMNHFAIGFFNAKLRESPGSLVLLDQAHSDALSPGIAVYTGEL